MLAIQNRSVGRLSPTPLRLPAALRQVLIHLALALSLARASAQQSIDPALLTVAETSDFRATAHYADVVTLCERLAAASPLVKLSSLGKSGEGRELPLLLIADPPVSEPAPPRSGPSPDGEQNSRAAGSQP